MDLDKTDKKILKILQQNGRIRNLDLADTIGLSNTPCAKRVKRLEDTGVISGYQAIVNPDAAGKYVSAFVLMQIGSNTREAANRFAEEIKGILAVTECYMTTGSLDYIARIHANSLSDYEAVIKDELGKIKDIVKLETLIILNNIVSTRGISIWYRESTLIIAENTSPFTLVDVENETMRYNISKRILSNITNLFWHQK